MIFRLSAPYPYLLDGIKFCFHVSLIFRLLPSKIGTVKKVKTLHKRWQTIQSQLHQRKEILFEIQRFVWCSKFWAGQGFPLCTA